MKLLNETQIKQIFKGDQNLFWDSLITDSALFYYLKSENSSIKFIPFIHDEKFGAPDQNLIHCLEKPNHSFFISEDYADSSGDATYLNLDISCGIFYFPVLEESRLKEYSISIKSLSRTYAKLHKDLDSEFVKNCSKFGLVLGFVHEKDENGLTIPNQEELNCFFDIHPEQRIFYVFTKAFGRYGVAPVKDNNILLSSVFIKDSNLYQILQTLMENYLLNGVYSQSNPDEHELIKTRYKLIENLLIKTLKENGSIADLEENISQSIFKNIDMDLDFHLTRSSYILSYPEQFNVKHFYLESFLSNNITMSELYNSSLNQTKMSIQRIHIGETLTNLPFYVNWKNEVGRHSRSELIMNSITGQLFYKKQNNYEVYEKDDSSFISGKAIPFLNEFRFENNIIALPEHGSKYTPACDAFVIKARLKNFHIPDASILRISVHFLDHLKFLGERELVLPNILIPFFGKTIKCIDFSNSWRKVTNEIDQILISMKKEISDGRETVFARNIFSEYKEGKNILASLAKYMDPSMFELLINLTEQYVILLNTRLKKEKNLKLDQKYKMVTFKIKLIIRYYMKQLVQVKDGLIYLNDRPYSLAIYLMFGEYFMEELIKNVTFRVETV